MHIKTTMRYHLTLPEWPSLINQQTSAGKDVDKREPQYTVGGMKTGIATAENSMEFPQKIIKWNCLLTQ